MGNCLKAEGHSKNTMTLTPDAALLHTHTHTTACGTHSYQLLDWRLVTQPENAACSLYESSPL